MQATSPGATEDLETRRRVVDGLAAAVVEKGYVAATIADIARHARVSKRTFYEHFETKEECFLAGYKAASDETLAIITAAAAVGGGAGAHGAQGPHAAHGDAARSWQARAHVAARAYLEALETFPALTRTYLVEIYAVGPRALEMRRVVHGRFAELLRTLAAAARKEAPEMRPLSAAMATAVVGGIHELVLAELESGTRARLVHLAETVTDLLVAVVAPRDDARLTRRGAAPDAKKRRASRA